MPPLCIHNVATAIPGYGAESTGYGKLISTTELLSRMSDGNPDAVPTEFVKEKLGIVSLAMTHSTASICRTLWENPQTDYATAFRLSQGARNAELYEMFESVVRQTTQGRDLTRIVKHLHISPVTAPYSVFRFCEILRDSGVNTQVTSLHIPAGCSGILTALSLADSLLPDNDSLVLVTAESDMSLFCHQRFRQKLTKDALDDWLWGAVFGEGVGAMLVGRARRGEKGWRLSHLHEGAVETEWRVGMQWDNSKGAPHMHVAARAVKRTYLQHITANARALLDDAGGIDNLRHLCLHESNAKLVRKVAESVGAPANKVPSICATTGSLACVSIFALLDRSLHSTATNGRPEKSVGVAVIGEAGGVIRAGRFVVNGC